ncbi:unnamed protein product [Anisakis simplex]|uniref:Smr domain-containing protein n=1 Tax=Anisakis simplex TaxID=6269 RepID=A0A0M3JVV2_ANISI|nr:unnamed protein product [Anisakis simplex]
MEDSDETSQYDYQSGSSNSNDQTNNIISDQVPKPSRLNGFIAVGFKTTAQIDLGNIQQETVILQEEIERCLEKKKELYDQANRAKDLRIKQFYIAEAQNFDRRAREYSSNVNDLIESANFTSNTVDLHSMNVTSALKLLRKKLDAVDRPLNMRTGRSGKKLTVITGYGKSSNGLSKLKPAVIQWLKQCGYECVALHF